MTPQRKAIDDAQFELGLTMEGLAEALDTNLQTLKAWKYERNKMPGTAYIAIKHLIEQLDGS